MEEKTIGVGGEFFVPGDRNPNHPLHVVRIMEGPLQLNRTGKKGGPNGNFTEWRITNGRVIVARIGRGGKEFPYPPDQFNKLIFVKANKSTPHTLPKRRDR